MGDDVGQCFQGTGHMESMAMLNEKKTKQNKTKQNKKKTIK